MANLAGLAGFVSELRAMRTNLDRLRHVDAALSIHGKLGGGSCPLEGVYQTDGNLNSACAEPPAVALVYGESRVLVAIQ
jgi:hypothetical protein